MKQLYDRLLLEFRDNTKTSWGKNELVNFIIIMVLYIEELEKKNAQT